MEALDPSRAEISKFKPVRLHCKKFIVKSSKFIVKLIHIKFVQIFRRDPIGLYDKQIEFGLLFTSRH